MRSTVKSYAFCIQAVTPGTIMLLLAVGRERITQHWRHRGGKTTCHFAASSKHLQKKKDACPSAMFTSAFLPRRPRGLRASTPKGLWNPPGGPRTRALCASERAGQAETAGLTGAQGGESALALRTCR